jgi:two-component system CheB/CheR fusion protein
VIPPRKHLLMADGHLLLTVLPHEYGKRSAVDIFFCTLAETHGSRSIAIVLSGADGDGAMGIKRIKEVGGITIAQKPKEAQHEGMPRSAIETGMVDWVLPVAEMPRRLLENLRKCSS